MKIGKWGQNTPYLGECSEMNFLGTWFDCNGHMKNENFGILIEAVKNRLDPLSGYGHLHVCMCKDL